jgi:hypothetical protein
MKMSMIMNMKISGAKIEYDGKRRGRWEWERNEMGVGWREGGNEGRVGDCNLTRKSPCVF